MRISNQLMYLINTPGASTDDPMFKANANTHAGLNRITNPCGEIGINGLTPGRAIGLDSDGYIRGIGPDVEDKHIARSLSDVPATKDTETW